MHLSIQLYTVVNRPTHPEKFIRDKGIAPVRYHHFPLSLYLSLFL